MDLSGRKPVQDIGLPETSPSTVIMQVDGSKGPPSLVVLVCRSWEREGRPRVVCGPGDPPPSGESRRRIARGMATFLVLRGLPTAKSL